MRMRVLVVCVGVLSCWLCLAGCGMNGGTAAGKDVVPNKLHAIRYEFAYDPKIDKIVKDLDLMEEMYSHVLSLPSVPQDQVCPALAGPHYEFTFYEKQKVILHITADRSGCGTVTFSDKDVRQADDVFWSQTKRALEIQSRQRNNNREASTLSSVTAV